MIRKDDNAYFEASGFIFKRYTFKTSKYCAKEGLNRVEYNEMSAEQQESPVSVLKVTSINRTYWMFDGDIYWENEGLDSYEVKALLLHRKKQRKKQIEKAVTLMEHEDTLENEKQHREPIPDNVKIFVWKRDGAKCVKCGSKENLEFDHVIPFSRGGSSTARNLQLLCETCNRSKGANIF